MIAPCGPKEGKQLTTDEPRLAVLIDADNTSAKWADAIFKEVATLGEASVRRIYGDFSSSHLGGWASILARLAVTPHQQFAYTKGKNSSDIALVIDAMDLLHSGRFDGFVLVSSDSDFTRLASRIREQGLQVFGIGREKTPEAFRRACKRFIFVENLLSQASPSDTPDLAAADVPPAGGAATPPNDAATEDVAAADAAADGSRPMPKQPPSKAMPLLTAAIRNHDDDWVPLSVIGNHVHEANPEFDPRTYGCQKLTDLLDKTGMFEIRRDQVPVVARLKKLQ